jgi:hypothetical protein
VDYRHYFPSKQFVFLVGSIVLAGVIIYGASLLGKGKTMKEVVSLSTTKPLADQTMADSDGDSLPDWEEAVRGTDPHKADTDNDSTPDGEEVHTGRNPLKTGPDDSLASEENEKFVADLLAAASSTNMTDNLSRTLFAEYLGARNAGMSGDAAQQQQVVNDLISKANVGLKGRTYTQKDLITVGNDEKSTHAFANASALAIRRHPSATFMNTINMLSLAIDNQDENAVAKLKAIGKEYRALARDLAEIPVPAGSAATYLKGINALESAGASFEDITYVTEDPVRAVAGIKNYNVLLTIGTQSFVLIAHDIIVNGVRFVNGEPGTDWYQFIAGLGDTPQTQPQTP